MAREAAIQQKKQDDCIARLNAVSSRDAMENAFERLANADRCRANPNITPEQVALLKPGETLGAPVTPDFSKAQPIFDISKAQPIDLSAGMVPKPSASSHLPPGYTLEQPAKKPVPPKAIEGTVIKDAVVYGESLPGGPGGQVLGKVESGTHVRVIRLDSIYGNVQVRTPNGITGWLSSNEINY